MKLDPINPIKKTARAIFRRPLIQSIVREHSSGGIVFRRLSNDSGIEILLIQDARNRWSIPKGRVEEGEKLDQTAGREVMEETGLKKIEVHAWLGKVDFRFRRQNSLVLKTMQVYLVEATDPTEKLRKEDDRINDIRWFPAIEAFDRIEYEEIGKLILLAMKRVRNGTLK